MKKIFKLFTKELTEDEKFRNKQLAAIAKESKKDQAWIDSLKKKP